MPELADAGAEQRNLPSAHRFGRLGLVSIFDVSLIRLQMQVGGKKADQMSRSVHRAQLLGRQPTQLTVGLAATPQPPIERAQT